MFITVKFNSMMFIFSFLFAPGQQALAEHVAENIYTPVDFMG